MNPSAPPPGGPTAGASRWDRAALRAGAGVCIVSAVPLQVLALAVGSDSALALVFRIGALLGFFLGAGVAAWAQQRGLPLAHGLVTAIASFAVVQLAFIVGRAIAGTDLRLFGAFGNLTPVVGAGLLGGLLGQSLQRRGIVPRAQVAGGLRRRSGGSGEAP